MDQDPKHNRKAVDRDFVTRLEALENEKNILQQDIKHLLQEATIATGRPKAAFTDFVRMRKKGITSFRDRAQDLRELAEAMGDEDPFAPADDAPPPPDDLGGAAAAVIRETADKSTLN